VTPLKELQGLIWREGYESGVLVPDLYEDVPGALHEWRSHGGGIAIYSSGSMAAQRLLLAHSRQGDLTGLVDAHFDTTTGAKHDPRSYARIGEALAGAPREVLFVSDSVAELDAARASGMETLLAAREMAAEPASAHTPIRSFSCRSGAREGYE
jgi:enolase-phosphatase E1